MIAVLACRAVGHTAVFTLPSYSPKANTYSTFTDTMSKTTQQQHGRGAITSDDVKRDAAHAVDQA